MLSDTGDNILVDLVITISLHLHLMVHCSPRVSQSLRMPETPQSKIREIHIFKISEALRWNATRPGILAKGVCKREFEIFGGFCPLRREGRGFEQVC